MKKVSTIAAALLFCCALANAQDTTKTTSKDEAYLRTINSRAQKIVATLSLTDSIQAFRVQSRIAAHYAQLNDVYTRRDELVKKCKEELASDKPALEARLKSIDEETAKQIAPLHTSFLKDLSRSLTPQQITKVKDGLTYNIVNVTYDAYVDMIPSLTEPQKAQLMTWLVEAREIAMDAESSDKKHAWFGKYKGRINNYLSKEGYDIQKERAAWELRLKERAKAK